MESRSDFLLDAPILRETVRIGEDRPAVFHPVSPTLTNSERNQRMSRSKLGLLGFCIAGLGLMVLNAGIASATVGANWLILTKGGFIKTGAELNSSLGLERETKEILHSKILGFTVLYECEKIGAVNAKLLPNGSVGKELNFENKPVGAQIKFSECIAFVGGE